MENYADRYGGMINDITKTFDRIPIMEGPALGDIASSLGSNVPLDKLADRRAWRDERLVAIAKLKKQLASKKD